MKFDFEKTTNKLREVGIKKGLFVPCLPLFVFKPQIGKEPYHLILDKSERVDERFVVSFNIPDINTALEILKKFGAIHPKTKEYLENTTNLLLKDGNTFLVLNIYRS